MRLEIGQSEFEQYLSLIGDGISGLENWERQIKAELGPSKPDALVILNANPFTTGQLYLAQIASRRCTRLLVLVIQGKPESGGKGNHENTGIVFPFPERLKMAEEGLEGIPNATVLPSGPYIISRDDYPQGYLKKDYGAAQAHGILDSMVLAHVCESLGIRTVFAGDEPRDELSEIHLNSMRLQFQGSAICLKVAERKRIGDRYISSSLARLAMAEKNRDGLSSLVPEKTLEFILSGSSLRGLCS